MPFALRRPGLLLRDLFVDRERPDLAALEGEDRPEIFLWRILPHAARTFSACIALLPSKLARPAAVAYLYCRCLDSYEDLIPEPDRRIRALRTFAGRFSKATESPLDPAPPLDQALARDQRNRAHLVLVNNCRRVDAVFGSFDTQTRSIIRDLIEGMSEGMVWGAQTLKTQRGVLRGPEQLSRYCGHVLGLPVVFTARMLKLHYHRHSELNGRETQDALLTGELVQLANITRDIEKDLKRGVAYHELLGSDLRRDGSDPALAERIRLVREEFLLRALRLAPAYRRFVHNLNFSGLSWGRASAVLMLLFTDRYYRSCARRVGRSAWSGPDSGAAVLFKSLPAIFSTSWAERLLGSTEVRFLEFVERCEAQIEPRAMA